MGCFEGGGGWNPRFSRPFNDWELETVERFLVTSQGKKVHTNMEDKVQWKEAKNGLFSVIAYCSTLAGIRIVPFPNSIIWSSCVPPKVGFFVSFGCCCEVFVASYTSCMLCGVLPFANICVNLSKKKIKMIGRWRRWRDSLSPYKGRRWSPTWRIGFSGKRPRMVCFQLNPFIAL